MILGICSGSDNKEGARKNYSAHTSNGGYVFKWIIAVYAVVITFTAERVYADNFRCPNGNIVSTGYSISTVAAKCDPPASTFRREEPIEAEVNNESGRTGTKAVYIEVQEWTYNKGSTLLHTLIFRNGTLVEVRTDGFVQ